jgi:hypothetical protein
MAPEEQRLALQQYTRLREKMVAHLNDLASTSASEYVPSDSDEKLLRAGAALARQMPTHFRAFRDMSSLVFQPHQQTLQAPALLEKRLDEN